MLKISRLNVSRDSRHIHIHFLRALIGPQRRNLTGNKDKNDEGDDDGKGLGMNMSEKSFWERFYKQHNKNSFEWIVDTSSIGEILSQIDSQKARHKQTLLFDAGCGSSLFSTRLSESISAANFLICGDFSRQALELIKSNSSQQTHVDFVQCDCKALPFRDNIFDIIIDKGYLDSLLKKMFIASSELAMIESIDAMNNLLDKLEFVDRHKDRKYLIQITDETPELRISLLDRIDQSKFRIEYFFKEISVNDSCYYAYFIRKV